MIIWLASYPKSGNTWLRMFLKSYYQKPGTKFNLEKTVHDDFKTHSGFPDLNALKHLKVDYSKFSDIVRNWETLQDYINLNGRTNFLKTHNSMCTVGPYKFTTSKNTKGGIYLVRDTRDVLVSYSNHTGYDHETTFKHMCNSDNYESTSTEIKDKIFYRSLLGSWANHYNSWKSFKSAKILIIKYEDMIADTYSTFKKIIRYLGEIDDLKLDEGKLNDAIKQTEFKELQKLEKKQGFSEKGAGSLFFRKGKAGSWKDELSSNLIERVEKIFSKEMIELGYL